MNPATLPDLPDRGPGDPGPVSGLTPTEIVSELDRYVIGQRKAKKAVAIALRNRWRRGRAPDPIRAEIMPNNIILIGPTGVGKTEIARRLARLAQAPFIKVEASKFTEVGYVGRDVESMVRDLMEIGVSMVRGEMTGRVEQRAAELAEERLLNLLLPRTATHHPEPPRPFEDDSPSGQETLSDARERLRRKLRAGALDQRPVEFDTSSSFNPLADMLSQLGGGDELALELQGILSNASPRRTRRRRLTVSEARRVLVQEEAQKLVDMDEVIIEARHRTEEQGIVFIDEIDKIVVATGSEHGPDVSRGGVQRDLLPVVEGSSVLTKYGIVRTDHILFIAAGAFTKVKPADMIPELQGRFPIRVELDSLAQGDFRRILLETENSLLRQYSALVASEGVELEFTEEAVGEIALTASYVNTTTEDIGARRLHTVLSALLEDIMFRLPDPDTGRITISGPMVRERLQGIAQDKDLSRYIL
ncbi:MAG: ATP-dependent protease ATPase subunit HslU [bacterium]